MPRVKQADDATLLQDLVNAPTSVKAFGQTYQIKRFGLGQAARALQYIGPFGYLLKNIQALPKDENGKVIASAEEMMDLAVTAIAISGDSVIGLISVAISEPVEWLEDKDPMDGLEVLAAALEKNMDFFSQANIERARRLFGRLTAAIPALGGDTSTN